MAVAQAETSPNSRGRRLDGWALFVYVDLISVSYGLGEERGIIRTRLMSFGFYLAGLLIGLPAGAWVDRMRRRVLELSHGRIVRDEATGLYTRDETTREFAQRLRSPTERPPGV